MGYLKGTGTGSFQETKSSDVTCSSQGSFPLQRPCMAVRHRTRQCLSPIVVPEVDQSFFLVTSSIVNLLELYHHTTTLKVLGTSVRQ